MIARASAVENAGTSSCSDVSARTYAGGSRSVRTDALWPILMNAGPAGEQMAHFFTGCPPLQT